MPEEMKPQQQINIEIGEKEAEGIYSNMYSITFNPAEFVIDFGRILPHAPKAKIFARIVMTPQHARGLFGLLEDSIKKFEERFGKIKSISPGENSKGFGFMSSGEKQ